MSIVTKTGDSGQTGLFGGKRVSKADARIHAYGTVDELNSLLGELLATEELPERRREHLTRIQHILFRVGGDLATPMDATAKVPRIEKQHVEEIEGWILSLEPTLPLLTQFILPGGSGAGARLHVARTVARRAERWVIALQEQEPINEHVRVYLNRLSDYLFLAARAENLRLGAGETAVEY